MDQLRAKKFLPQITALAEGKTIQYRGSANDNWTDVEQPSFLPGVEYRIKPDPAVVKSRRYLWDIGSATPQVGIYQHDGRNILAAPMCGTWIDLDWVEHTVERRQ